MTLSMIGMKKNVSSQNLANYEMSTINIENNEISSDESPKLDINNDEIVNDYIYVVSYFYQVFVHVFIFSIFESLFFWLYITKEEDQAILNQIEDVVLVGNLFCTNINDDIDFSSLYDYQKDKRDNYNQELPFNNTIMLNTYLLCTIVLLNIFLKFSRTNIVILNYNILKNQSVTFLCLFVYEYLFFKNVIYNYVPNSSNKIVKKIFEQCV
jgi:hypothetical protein